MLFESPHANFQVICSRTLIKRHAVTGDEIDRVPAVWANFGKLGPQYDFLNPETGETMQGAEITGHFFDTDLEAAQNGWDQETKEMVETKLLNLCRTQPDRIKLIEREVARALLPWPSYDEMEPEEAVEFASRAGLVEAALAYERENLARQFVLEGLAASADAETELAAESEPVPVAEPVQAGKRGSRITV